jgi:phage terminase large subunit
MPLNPQGIWVPNLIPKQMDVFNDNHRFLLVSGPRKSGKTLGVLNKVVRHLWEVPGASVGIFAKTIKSATDFGVWQDLIRFVIPEWVDADIGFSYSTTDTAGRPGPKVNNQTRTLYFAIHNYWWDQLGDRGGISECKLYSLDYAEEVEAKVKGMRFSMVYFSELGNFESRVVFTATIPQLRMMPPIVREQHQWMADANPTEQGEQSWIYDLFYRERTLENHPDPAYQKEIGLIEIFTQDNPYLTQRDIDEIKSICHHDTALYQRYVNGLWVAGGNLERHFSSVFKSNIHVLGDCNNTDEEKWDVILPSEQCVQLITGWDLGEVNHAAVILEKVLDSNGNMAYFAVLDELVYIADEVGTEEFTVEMVARMERMEKTIGHPVEWKHYSDEQAIKQWKSSIGGVDAALVRRASRDRIILEGVKKEPDSVRKRVHIMKRMLLEDKLFISANCFKVINMITELRRHKKDYVQRTSNPQKHPFDALTYALSMETIMELDYNGVPTVGRTGLLLVG